jgi:hypothetical protein
MLRTRNHLLIVAILIALAATGCGSRGPSEQELANEAEWEWLQETQQELNAMRQELAEAALQEQVETLTEEYTWRLVGLLNADPMIEGEEPTARQLTLLAMKSDEDLILAQEWIDRGGDYKRAIEIYNTALMFDPENPKLQAALAEAEANRYMSQERFLQVKKGMTEGEVRQLLGQANLHNVRKYEDKGVVAWFYPTSETGEAAAVWFEPDKKSGEMKVYQVKFEAVKPNQGDEG